MNKMKFFFRTLLADLIESHNRRLQSGIEQNEKKEWFPQKMTLIPKMNKPSELQYHFIVFSDNMLKELYIYITFVVYVYVALVVDVSPDLLLGFSFYLGFHVINCLRCYEVLALSITTINGHSPFSVQKSLFKKIFFTKLKQACSEQNKILTYFHNQMI
jgi:hypothetical protein